MANTTADKLAKLAATKADLKAALAEKGQTVGDVFSTYPAVVRAIETNPAPELITITTPDISTPGRTFFCYDGLHYGEEQVSVPVGSCVFYFDDGGPVGVNSYGFSGSTTEVGAIANVTEALYGQVGIVFCPTTSGQITYR